MKKNEKRKEKRNMKEKGRGGEYCGVVLLF